MYIIEYPAKEEWEKILARPRKDTASLETAVRRIMEEVRLGGDRAVDKYSLEFDKVDLQERLVAEPEWKAAETTLSEPLKAAIRQAENQYSKISQ